MNLDWTENAIRFKPDIEVDCRTTFSMMEIVWVMRGFQNLLDKLWQEYGEDYHGPSEIFEHHVEIEINPDGYD